MESSSGFGMPCSSKGGAASCSCCYPSFSFFSRTKRTKQMDLDVFDEFFNETCEGDVEVAIQIVELYLDRERELLLDMHIAIENSDAPTLRRAAHTLKSNSALFGAKTLAFLCQELENRASQGILQGAITLLEEIQERQTRLHLILEVKLAQLKGVSTPPPEDTG
jgi:HPt (histidine-containing phosphotransfer) domain-containing protein